MPKTLKDIEELIKQRDKHVQAMYESAGRSNNHQRAFANRLASEAKAEILKAFEKILEANTLLKIENEDLRNRWNSGEAF